MFLAHLLQIHHVFLAHLLQVHHVFLANLLQVHHVFMDQALSFRIMHLLQVLIQSYIQALHVVKKHYNLLVLNHQAHLQHYKTVENEYLKNMTMKLLNTPRIVRLYVVPMTHLHFKLLMLEFLLKQGSYTVIVRTSTRDVFKLHGIVLSNGSFFALLN